MEDVSERLLCLRRRVARHTEIAKLHHSKRQNQLFAFEAAMPFGIAAIHSVKPKTPYAIVAGAGIAAGWYYFRSRYWNSIEDRAVWKEMNAFCSGISDDRANIEMAERHVNGVQKRTQQVTDGKIIGKANRYAQSWSP